MFFDSVPNMVLQFVSVGVAFHIGACVHFSSLLPFLVSVITESLSGHIWPLPPLSLSLSGVQGQPSKHFPVSVSVWAGVFA